MFVELAKKRNGAIDGQIEALRYQHDQGREFIAAIDGALDDYEKGDPRAQSVVRDNAVAFASLLKHHIHIEDHIFFPMSQESMTAEEREGGIGPRPDGPQLMIEIASHRKATTFRGCRGHSLIASSPSFSPGFVTRGAKYKHPLGLS